jgi:hypothetical protein
MEEFSRELEDYWKPESYATSLSIELKLIRKWRSQNLMLNIECFIDYGSS